MKEKYFITLHDFSYQEYEVWRLLNKYCNYETNITGYTVNQIVINSNKEANLTTQKVRTILKKFEKEGYIQFLSSGSKGKESTLKLTIKQQLFNNNTTNKNEELQQVEDIKQQQSNNNLTTLSKKKEKDNSIYSLVIDYLNSKANTKFRASTKNTQSYINARVREGYKLEDFIIVIDTKCDDWLGTEWERYLRPATLFGTKFENYLNEANKKAPVGAGTKKNNSVNPSVCRTNDKYSRGVEML
jgi:uncharacterized phage protein (TIGR02220 family)